jgi:superfamily II DNA or RNA helicase
VQLDRSIVPRRWQGEAVELWERSMRGIARVVTGGGKTVFAYMCMERFFGQHPDGSAIIVVPTIALLDQWFVDICDATDLDESEVACYSGGSRPDKPATINIAVMNTARRVATDLSESGPTILIVDECHRAGAPENSRALEGCHEATLGLSATYRATWTSLSLGRLAEPPHASPKSFAQVQGCVDLEQYAIGAMK